MDGEIRARDSGTRRAFLWVLLPLAIFFAASTRFVRAAPDFDESIFLDVGTNIAATGLPIRSFAFDEPAMFFDHTPAWVYYMGLLTAMSPDPLQLARLSAFAAGAGTVAVAFMTVLAVRGVSAALLTAVVLASSPFFGAMSWFARMEVPLAFFLVIAVFALVQWRQGHSGWIWVAGSAIAIAVMLKEIAFGFWFVAVAFVLLSRRRRDALILALPAVVAFAGWFAYAAALDSGQLAATIDRWVDPAGWDPTDPRGDIGIGEWMDTVASRILGWPIVALISLSLGLWLAGGRRAPAIAWLVIAYGVLAVIASVIISLKEPRFLIAVVPMAALAIGFMVDWGRHLSALRGWLLRKGLRRPRGPRKPNPDPARDVDPLRAIQ